MRAISAPTSAARFSKFSGQFSAQTASCSVVGGQRLEMLLPLVGCARSRRTRRGTARRRSDIPPLPDDDGDVHSSRCAFDAGLDGRSIVAGKEARLQLADPVPALGKRQIRIVCETALDPQLVELLIVKGAECRRQPAQRPDQPKLRGDDVNDKTEPHLLRKREAILGFALHLDERIARREKVRVQLIAAVGRVGEIADLVCDLEGTAHQIAASPDMSRPRQDCDRRSPCRSWPGSASAALFDQVIAEPAEAKSGLVVAEVRAGDACQAMHRRSTTRRSCRARG